MDEQTNKWKDGMDIPKVSIVTACFNSAKTIRDTIESVINQTYQNIEYIIIDGGSTDGTVDIIKEYEPHIAKWVSEPDEGIYDAMNKGIKMVTGEIIGIINSDDWYRINTVELVINQFFKNKNIELFHGDNEIYDTDDNLLFMIKPDQDYKNLRHNMVINHPGCFITKEAYKKYGVYKTDYRLAADYELILRMFINGALFQYVDRVLASMRTGGIGYRSAFASCQESRDIVIEYGCPHIIAYKDYYFKISKIRIRKMLEKLKLQSLIRLKRMLSRRTVLTKEKHEI